jgi:hypothetical protein
MDTGLHTYKLNIYTKHFSNLLRVKWGISEPPLCSFDDLSEKQMIPKPNSLSVQAIPEDKWGSSDLVILVRVE